MTCGLSYGKHIWHASAHLLAPDQVSDVPRIGPNTKTADLVEAVFLIAPA